jgi:Protein of unknown function (DUF2735)
MTDKSIRKTAEIVRFPGSPRVPVKALDASARTVSPVRVPVTDASDAWYHDAAIQDTTVGHR